MLRRVSVLTLLLCMGALSVRAQQPEVAPSSDDGTITKVGTTAAQFLKFGMGARAIAMGGSFVAEASDLSALYWNAAGLTNIDNSAVQLSYTDYLVGVSYSTAAFGTNLGGFGTLAASILYLDSGTMTVRDEMNPDGTGEQFKVQNIAFQLSYARALTDQFSIGSTVKYVRETIWHSSASAIAFDIGTLFVTPYERLSLGASFSNFGPKMQMDGRDILHSDDPTPDKEGDIGIANAKYAMEEAPLPLLFRVGLAWDAVNTASHRVTLSTDAAHPNDNSEYVNLGFEYVFRRLIALRAGYRNLWEANGEQGLTLGAGLNVRLDSALNVRIDYAYASFGRLNQTHWFTVNMGF